MPKELAHLNTQPTVDKDGKPIVDEEGGITIQPIKGFVVKTKDENGQKVFINMTSHEAVDSFENKPIPAEPGKEVDPD